MAKTEKKVWTESEDKFIKENYLSKTRVEMGKILGVTSSSVSARMHKLGLKTVTKRRYTPEEEEFIIDNYKTMPIEELAKKFDVTPMAIRSKLANLKVSTSLMEKDDYVYMKVSNDKYELPILTADSVQKLAELDGVTAQYIYSQIHRRENNHCRTPYLRVKIEDLEEE